MAKHLFITGTGTDVGKTYVTGLILKKLQKAGIHAAYYKAAMSGNEKDTDGKLLPGDALFVKDTAGISQKTEEMCPFVYENAVSPHLASRMEGNPVRMDVVRQGFYNLDQAYEYVTMEGSGGILCPICYDEQEIWLEDVIKELSMPCLLVADAGLGTINSVVLTVEYMRAKNIPVKAIIFNHFHPGNVMEEDNKRMCDKKTGLQVVSCVRDGDTDLDLDLQTLLSFYE